MPTNRTKRKRAKILDAEIPEDLLQWLRFGTFPEQQPGERLSELFGHVVFFTTDVEALAWLQGAWRRHERLIRQGVDGEPFIIGAMQRLRKFIDGRRSEEE